MADSARIRRAILEKRKALSPGDAALRSGPLIQRFLEAVRREDLVLKGLKIGMYRSLPTEPDLRGLEPYLLEQGARLFFPRVVGRDKMIEFAEADFVGGDSAWQLGPYGIQEPHMKIPPVDPAELDLIFVPGVAFGSQGERIGMGAGYYDRYLPANPQALRLALIFDFQRVEGIQPQPWDQPVHWILTESQEFWTPQGNQMLAALQKKSARGLS